MVHISENAIPLSINKFQITDFIEINEKIGEDNEVCLIILPPVKYGNFSEPISDIKIAFQNISKLLGQNSVLITIGEPVDLVHIHDAVAKDLRYQHWVCIKNNEVYYDNKHKMLPHSHFGALVHTKYDSPLKHIKTRIAYSYCPSCEKTTKDYGGKKHTYHQAGTLISDVWNDIKCDLNGDLESVIARFSDFLGLEPHHKLLCFDCRNITTNRSNITLNEQNQQNNLIENVLELSEINQNLQGDVLERLKDIPDNSIDFIFTDPPYNLNKTYHKYDDDKDIEEYFLWCDQWLAELIRILKPGRTLALLNIPLSSIRHFLFLEKSLHFQNWIVWDALSFPVRLIMPAHYTILCFTKGESRKLPVFTEEMGDEYQQFINGSYNPLKPLEYGYCIRASCIKKRKKLRMDDKARLTDLWQDIHRLKHNSYRVNHPCQIPPRLMYRLISIFTKPDEVVLDCFNGSGTTTLTAEQLGRKYLGIENSQEYHELILQRHEEISKGLDPFRKEKRNLTSKNSPVPRMAKRKYKIPKKELQLEVKRVKELIGHMPTRDELILHGKYSIDYYDHYFSSWGEVCAAARTTGMTEEKKEV